MNSFVQARRQPVAGGALVLVLLVSLAVSACGSTTADSTADTSTTDTTAATDADTSTAAGDAQPRQLTFNEDEDWNYGFSPDGSRIAFGSDRDGDDEVFVMNADGSGVVQLTDNDSDDWGGFWSPDGTRIAFSSDRDGDREVFVMNADVIVDGLHNQGQQPSQMQSERTGIPSREVRRNTVSRSAQLGLPA